MNRIADLPDADLHALRRRVRSAYAAFRARGLKLDMTRGKPAPDQLDLANDMLAFPGNRDHFTEAGEDARNYGVLQGLPEARALFAPMLGAPPGQICVADNSSLAVMHDCIVWALLKGVPGSLQPWGKAPGAKTPAFICPVPGYDRHFALCEEYGIRMLPVPMTGQGPDMDAVEALAADPTVKGMWCVPKYSNPQRRGVFRRDRASSRRDARRCARFPAVLGQRVRGPPPDRKPAPDRQHPGCLCISRVRGSGVHLRLDVEDYPGGSRTGVLRVLTRQCGLVSGPNLQAHDRFG